MTQGFYEILSNVTIAKDIYEMVLGGDTSAITAPGQFINIKVEGFYLRRPISICDWDEKTITILFKTVGEGTQRLSEMKVGEKLDILVGLGNGFDVNACGESPLLVGGGIGTPPMLPLAQAYGEKATVITGFRSANAVILQEDFRKTGAETILCTDDGTMGVHGFVTQPLEECLKNGGVDAIFACGPMPMLKGIAALAAQYNVPLCEVSLEERMACGVGACLGCACKVKRNDEEYFLHVCKNGPVFNAEEVVW